MHKKITTLGLLALATFSVSTAQSADREARKAHLDLVPSVEAVTPGKAFDVAVRFDTEPDWHIYWQNSGDAGYPPRVEWSLPDGFTAGELQFPIPHRKVAAGNIVTNVLGDDPWLIAQITPPSDLRAAKVPIRAKVRYLICNVPCVEEDAELSLELPVQAGEPKPANGGLFERVRRFMPKESSKNLSLTPSIDPVMLAPGSKFELDLSLEVPAGLHVQSNAPTVASMFPTDVFTYRTSGILFDKSIFPPPKTRKDKTLGDVTEYEGKVKVRIPGEVDGAKPPGPTTLRGIVTFQTCTNDGNCFPPEAINFRVPVSIEGPKAGTSGAAVLGDPKIQGAVPFDSAGKRGIAYWLLFAFIGGLILNIMPCVLPVISIKVLSFVQQAGEEPKRVARLGMVFCLGIIASFEALAGVIIALKSAGHALGWGFQFQSPTFVVIMMGLMFVFALSLMGVFIITLPGAAYFSRRS